MRDGQAGTIALGAGVLEEKAEAGERNLEMLHRDYARPLFRYALALTSSVDDAEDAVQEVFVRMAKEWKRVAKVQNVRAYLYTAARNAAFSILRSRHRRDLLHDAVCEAFCSQTAGRSAESMCEEFGMLPVDQREVLVLKVYDQMTFKEIAETVGASINTVASRYKYAIGKLREALEADENG